VTIRDAQRVDVKRAKAEQMAIAIQERRQDERVLNVIEQRDNGCPAPKRRLNSPDPGRVDKLGDRSPHQGVDSMHVYCSERCQSFICFFNQTEL
jgi:hypothetical protein